VQFACICTDVEFICKKGEPCKISSCAVTCVLVNGNRGELTEAVRLWVKLLSFSWSHEFKVLNGGPFPVILGLDFIHRTGMSVAVAS
jgi:hypothetical protein